MAFLLWVIILFVDVYPESDLSRACLMGCYSYGSVKCRSNLSINCFSNACEIPNDSAPGTARDIFSQNSIRLDS